LDGRKRFAYLYNIKQQETLSAMENYKQNKFERANIQQVIVEGIENSNASYKVTIVCIAEPKFLKAQEIAEFEAAKMFEDAQGLFAFFTGESFNKDGFLTKTYELI
jgi:hypothetical protein